MAGYKEPTSFPDIKRAQSKMVPRHGLTAEMKTTMENDVGQNSVS